MEVEADLGTEQIKTEEAVFGILDYILLLGLVGLGAWWLLRSRNKKDPLSGSTGKSYSIQ